MERLRQADLAVGGGHLREPFKQWLLSPLLVDHREVCMVIQPKIVGDYQIITIYELGIPFFFPVLQVFHGMTGFSTLLEPQS